MPQPATQPTLAERQRAQFARMCADRLALIEAMQRNGDHDRAVEMADELAKMLGVRAVLASGRVRFGLARSAAQ